MTRRNNMHEVPNDATPSALSAEEQSIYQKGWDEAWEKFSKCEGEIIRQQTRREVYKEARYQVTESFRKERTALKVVPPLLEALRELYQFVGLEEVDDGHDR